MSETGVPTRLFAVLLLLWLLLNATLSLESLVVGVVVAGIVAFFLSASLSYLSGYRFTPASLAATLGFLGYFLVELVKSNLAMATIVLQPRLPIDPAIVRIRTGLKNPTARLLLANAITLTPGTLSVELKGEWFYIHWVVATTNDIEETTRTIAAGFERYLEVMYG
ncbi:MAG: Na+/H+ antiporter subunit E [Alphaproteobacteria bacterium]|nr:Na+/H+ antiporter subunit E [Alphaproteobacteria bacterium]